LTRELFNNVCREWTIQKLAKNALPFLVVVAIITINFALQYVFKLLSKFERHESISSESTSRVIKIFFAQFLNTGVIILFVNASFSRTGLSNLLAGHYEDFSSSWYLNPERW